MQETRFSRKSVGTISGKKSEYKLLWLGNAKGLGGAGIFFQEMSI